jgi:hypothetical protein
MHARRARLALDPEAARHLNEARLQEADAGWASVPVARALFTEGAAVRYEL